MTFDYLTRQSGLDTLSKLKQLEIQIRYWNIDRFFLDGHEWERFFSNSMSHLLKFDFYFSFSKTIDRSLNTFRTRFWLEEKK
jgi:hypothetical protein